MGWGTSWLSSGALALALAANGAVAAAAAQGAIAPTQEPQMSRNADAPGAPRVAGTKADAFGSKNWKPAPPAKKVVKAKPAAPPPSMPVASPPPPSAPPIPFTYLGRMVDAGVTTVFLTDRQRNLAVKVGEVIDNNYKLEQITDSSLTLTYLPLNAQQQMSLGAPR